MLDLGWPEMLVIAIVLIVVVGPKDLPKMMRAFGRTTSKIRSMAGEFRKQFDDAIKEADLDEVKNLASEARKFNPASELKKAMSPMERAAKDVKAGLDSAMSPTKPGTSDAVAGDAATQAPASTAAVTGAKAASRPLPEAVGAKRAEAAAKAAKARTTAPATAAASPGKPVAAAKPAATARPKAASASAKAATPSKTAGTSGKAAAATSKPNAPSARAKTTKPEGSASKAGKKN